MLLYRYIIKELLFPFFASLSVIVFLFIMQQAVQLLDRVIEKGLDPIVVLEVFMIQLGWIIALAVPMAILTATLMTFGRMSGDNEITAIKASGRSMFSLLVPAFSAALVITVALTFFHDLILPEANHRAANLLSDISRKQPAVLIEPRVLITDFDNYTLYTHDIDPFTGDMSGIRILTDIPGQDPTVTVAAKGNIRSTGDEKFLVLTLLDGEIHSYPRDNTKEYYRGRFEEQIFYLENIDSRLLRTSSNHRSDREKNIAMMLSDISEFERSKETALAEFNQFIGKIKNQVNELDSISTAVNPQSPQAENFEKWAEGVRVNPALINTTNRSKNMVERTARRVHSNNLMIAQYKVEVHKKFAIPIACLLFVLIGAPLGIMARRGGLAVGASYSVFFFIAYWGFLITGESMADKLIVSPAFGMWYGNAIIAIFGLILTILMMRETSIRFDFIKQLFQTSVVRSNRVVKWISGLYIIKIPGLLLRLPRRVVNWFLGILPVYLISMFLKLSAGLLIAIIVIFVVVDYIGNLRRFENATINEAILYYWYYLPWIIQTILPVVLLLAAMFSMGKLAKNSELTAMRASGISVRRLTLPLLVLGLLLSALTFFGGEYILPRANEQRTELMTIMRHPPSQRQEAVNRREYRRNFYYFGNPNTMYYFEEFSTEPQFARKVQRQIFRNDGIAERIDAAEMIYDKHNGWKFIDGQKRTFDEDQSALVTFQSFYDTILTAAPSEMTQRVRSERELSYWELRNYIDMAKRRGEQVHRLVAEMEFKIALPLMNFVVILLGIAITARMGRKGGPVLFGIGLGLTFSYYLISQIAIVFAQNGHISPLTGAWIGNVFFFTIGIILYRKAAN
ncbi:hypothetical protein CHISP_2984 [Chitinispirillum alkaliphilum]|nr:hypothetical protein CHISP_2984 [Chitinispirillum alkaliphilum]